MAALKTRQSGGSVSAFLAAISDPGKRRDCRRLGAIMRKATGHRAGMWSGSMVGYGQYYYRYASGHEGSWFEVGYAPRAKNITIYIMPGFSPYASLMKRLGRYKTGKSCLYIERLDDIDLDILTEIINLSVAEMRERYPSHRGG